MNPDKANVFVAALWMVAITLVLFFLPLVNGLIGGAVGGYKAGSMKRAFIAALIPAVVVAAAMWAVLAIFNLPVMGLFAGAAIGVMVLLADIGLLVGAVVGGLIADNRGQRALPI